MRAVWHRLEPSVRIKAVYVFCRKQRLVMVTIAGQNLLKEVIHVRERGCAVQLRQL